jgi:hypothetical protein
MFKYSPEDYRNPKASRSNRSSSSAEGMSTSGKANFRNKLVVRIDFQDYDRSIRSVRKSIKEMNQKIKQLSRANNRTDKGFGIYIDSRDGGFGTQLNFNLPGGSGELSSSLSKALSDIGQRGKDIMQKYMRVETGRMKSSVAFMQRRSGSKFADVEIGWVRKWHKYYGFQEQGTKTGIKPMNAILRTRVELEPYANKQFNKAFVEFFLKPNERR